MRALQIKQFDALMAHVHRHQAWGPKDNKNLQRFMALALAGEAGELANLYKKEWRGDDLAPSWLKEHTDFEIADIANYAFLLAAVRGIDLIALMYEKMKAVEQRHDFKQDKTNAKGNAPRFAAIHELGGPSHTSRSFITDILSDQDIDKIAHGIADRTYPRKATANRRNPGKRRAKAKHRSRSRTAKRDEGLRGKR